VEGIFSISFQLHKDKIGALMGRKGSQVKEVENVSKAHISVEKDADPQGNRVIRIEGQLMAVYTAHMHLMKLYNDSEMRLQEPDPSRSRPHSEAPLRARDASRDASHSAGRNQLPSSVKEEFHEEQQLDSTAAMRAQLQRLQEELARAQLAQDQGLGTRASTMPLRTGTRYTAAPRR